MEGMDGSIIMNRAVWKASGHEETFSDPMVDCKMQFPQPRGSTARQGRREILSRLRQS
jgi:hypothetical protein